MEFMVGLGGVRQCLAGYGDAWNSWFGGREMTTMIKKVNQLSKKSVQLNTKLGAKSVPYG